MKKSYIIIIHLVFWFIVLSLNYSFLIFRGVEVPPESYIYTTVKSALEVGDFYVFYLFIVPGFLKNGSSLRLVIFSLIYALFYIVFYAAILTYLNILLGSTEYWDIFKIQLIVAAYYVILYIILGGLLKLALNGIESHRQQLKLEKQNIKSELALLRSQVNPHFLFNTLNTIHSFVISNHPKTAQAVIKLSDIMRYMLYEAAREKITLDKEIEYLKSYITLQNFRLEKSRFVEFELKGKTSGILIPPMFFTPFVENAFKHGKKKGEETGITINFEVNDKMIFFKIVNYTNPVKPSEIVKSEGFGLKNVKRRLELLYPQKHKLEIVEKDNNFTVWLQIELK